MSLSSSSAGPLLSQVDSSFQAHEAGSAGPTFRVAVSSADGKTVHQHFGRTTQFLIFEVAGSGIRFLERRENLPPCGTSTEEDGGHDEDRMSQTIDVVADCHAVVAAQIGYGAVQRLAVRNIQAYIIPDFIDSALKRLAGSGALKIPLRATERRTVE